jgi:glutathione synthase/RimK-type ligase-like ATP-grasp enzyme
VPYELVDCLSLGALERLRAFDILLWHFSNYDLTDMMHARSILYAGKEMGLGVFPDFPDAWHFDDKIAQAYVLHALGAPTPRWWVFYAQRELEEWLEGTVDFPVVAKLRTGSGSHNVRLLRSSSEVRLYARRMFGRGLDPSPSLLFKTTSNVRSSRTWMDVKARARRIPEFLRTRSRARTFPKERGYVFVQEFVPNEGFDLKIVVVAGKVSFLVRRVRKNDFRASGGGDLFYERDLVPDGAIRSARETARAMGSLCVGFDYVVHRDTGEAKIVEMSYGFSHEAVLPAGGYWNEAGEWIAEPLNAPEEILKALLLHPGKVRSP